MIIFIETTRNDGKKILINWQKITKVTQCDKGIELLMDNQEKIKIVDHFEDFRKILLEHELTLDENSRIIAPCDGGWTMVD